MIMGSGSAQEHSEDLQNDARSDASQELLDYEQLAEHEDDEDGDEEWRWDDAYDDIRKQVDDVAADETNVDKSQPSEDSEQGTRVKDPNYVFCPLPHRLPILRLFAKHASQHTLLPERHGQPRSAEEIYRDAVEEMYRHCKANNLCEVWAYVWNSWYSPSKWKLWARGAYSSSIPCKRTTMMVESLWRNLKRLVLIMHNRPRIDFTIHSIVTQTIPAYRITLSKIVNDSRDGRAAAPTHMQAAFKASWERLLMVPIKGAYKTSTTMWTCDCGAQKYHSYLLCKHLVQAADRPPPTWWTSLVRYHIPPFYTVPNKGKIASPPEDRINHAWVKRMPSTLHTKPEPSDADAPPSPLPPSSPPSSPGPGDEISHRAETPEPAEHEVIDLTLLQSSSPVRVTHLKVVIYCSLRASDSIIA